MTTAAKQFSYHFSIGNSTRGKVGMCFRVKATTKAQAVEKANVYLAQFEQGFALDKADDIEYCEVYTRAAVTAKDIDDFEECEEDRDEDGDDPKSCSCSGDDCTAQVGPDAPYFSTPCGTYCSECMENHVKACEICRNEFDFPATDPAGLS